MPGVLKGARDNMRSNANSGHNTVHICSVLLATAIIICLMVCPALCQVAPIKSGETLSSTIAESGGEAWFSFSAGAGDIVNILAVCSASNIEPRMTLMGPDGSIIDNDYSYSGRAWIGGQMLYQTGVYFIRLSDNQNVRVGSFKISLVQTHNSLVSASDPDGGPISSGDFKTGYLGIGDIDAYSFNAQAGDTISTYIDVMRQDRSMNVYLQTPSGDLITCYYGSLAMQLPETGTYFILAVPGDSAEVGNYVISFFLKPMNGSPLGITPIESGETLTGHLNIGECDAYASVADAGNTLTVNTAVISGDLNLGMTIIQPDGSRLQNLWSNNTQRLSQTGTYYILCSNGSACCSGDYTISLILTPGNTSSTQDPDGGPIESGEVKYGHLGVGDLDAFTMHADAGDILAAQAIDKNGRASMYLKMISPSGDIMTNDVFSSWKAPETGTYYFICQKSDAIVPVDYGFSVDKYPSETGEDDDIDGGPISSGDTKTGEITFADLDMFTFEANAGDVVNLSIVATTADLNPDIRVIMPNGDAMSPDYYSGPILDHPIQLNISGTYAIICRDYSGIGTGNYALSLIKNPGAMSSVGEQDGGPIASAETRNGYLFPGDIDAYTFDAKAGDAVTVRVTTANSGLQPVYDVQGPGGISAELMTYIQSMALYRIPIDGTYYILCRDKAQLQPGNYAISLAKIPGAVVSATDADGGKLESGEIRSGRIDFGDMDIYTFHGQAGQIATVSMEAADANLSPYFMLQNPDGTFNASSNSSCRTTLTQNGTYYLICMDNCDASTGSYRISFESADQIADAKRGENYSWADLKLAVVSAIFGDCFYVQDEHGTCGIRVNSTITGLAIGRRVNLSGTLSTADNEERCMVPDSVELSTFGSVTPVMMSNKALGGADWNCDDQYNKGQRGVLEAAGLNNIGLLVRTCGKVTHSGDGFFYIDDGSGIEDGSGIRGVKVDAAGLSVPSEGAFVTLTGISSCYKAEDETLRRLLRVRISDDIK